MRVENGTGVTRQAAYPITHGEIFVANSFMSALPDNVSVISDSTNVVVATIGVGSGPFGMAYDSGKGEVFVANRYTENVTVLSDNSDRPVASVSLPANSTPLAVGYDTGKGEVFVANYYPSTKSGDVSVISDATNAIVAAVPLLAGALPFGVAYDAGRGTVYVASFNSTTVTNSVSMISDSTNTVIATMDAGISHSVEAGSSNECAWALRPEDGAFSAHP